jgi:hypothetical protein
MRKVTLVALVALVGAVPATLSGQSAAEARIQAAIERTQQAGIPADLVQMKVREGQAKGIPADRIAAAAAHRADALLRAQDALKRAGVQPTRDDLAAGADALGAGVSAAALGAAADMAPGGQRTVAIAVLGALVGQGEGIENALARIQEAMSRGGPDALANLPAQAAAARAGQGGPPSQAGQGQDARPQGVPAPGQRPQGGRPGATPPTGGPPGGF